MALIGSLSGSPITAANMGYAGALLQRRIYHFTAGQTISSLSFVDVFTASFTPTRANSRLFLYCNLAYGKRGAGELQFPHRFLRNGTLVTQNSTATGASFDVMRFPDVANSAGHMHVLYQGMDEPNTTSAITYAFQILKVNAGYNDISINFNNAGSTSFIIDEVSL
jgi:hypothetical protein